VSTGSLGEGQANQEGLVLATRIWVYRVILSDIVALRPPTCRVQP